MSAQIARRVPFYDSRAFYEERPDGSVHVVYLDEYEEVHDETLGPEEWLALIRWLSCKGYHLVPWAPGRPDPQDRR